MPDDSARGMPNGVISTLSQYWQGVTR